MDERVSSVRVQQRRASTASVRRTVLKYGFAFLATPASPTPRVELASLTALNSLIWKALRYALSSGVRNRKPIPGSAMATLLSGPGPRCDARGDRWCQGNP